MSESDSDSTDSDNNNEPFYNQYLRLPQELSRYNPVQREIQIMSSSESEDSSVSSNDNPLFLLSPSSQEIKDVQLCNPSEDLDYMSDTSPLSPSDSFFRSFNRQDNEITNRTAPKKSSGNFLNNLYKREIGGYKNCAAWSTKFYQSIVTLQKLKLSKQLKAHRGCVNSLGFNYSGSMLASGSDDCKICLWNWSEGKCVLNYSSVHSGNIFQTKFLTSQGNHIVSSGRDGRVALYTLNNSDVAYRNVITRHTGSCNKIAIHSELPYVVLTSGEDGIIKIVDIRESDVQSVHVASLLHQTNARGSSMDIYGIDINPMKPYEFLIHGDDEHVRVYDRRDMSSGPTRILERPHLSGMSPNAFHYETHITSAVYSYCGTEILASYSTDDMYLFYPDDSPMLRHYRGHTNRMTIKSVNFYGPRSEYVMSGSDCGNIFIWDKVTEEIVQKKHADRKGVVNVLEAHPRLPVLATSGLDPTIKIWEPLNRWHQPNREELRMLVVESFQRQRRRNRQEGYLLEFRQLMDLID